MKSESEWHEFIDRAKNFHRNIELFKTQIAENEFFYRTLYNLKNGILNELNEAENLNKKQIPERAFAEIFDFLVNLNEISRIFFSESDPLVQGINVYDSVYKACFFSVLCTFLHDTVRIKGKSLGRFIYDNSLEYYNDKNSQNYFLYEDYSDDRFRNDITKLRQTRYRILSSRPVYNKRPEWSAMPKDSEYEWTFYYTLQVLDESLQDTYKRIGNLYNDIKKELNSDRDEGYQDRLANAYKKFTAKLKKLKYENYLELQKEVLEHICENDKYYGMNIYRFEKEFKLYIITYELKCLLKCEKEVEERDVLAKSIILKDIHFPKVYKDFASLSNISLIQDYACIFFMIRNLVTDSFYLIMDELIEKGYLGDDWESIFLDIINEMTENVFYDPTEIDYSILPKSQEKFMKLLDAPVRALLGWQIECY